VPRGPSCGVWTVSLRVARLNDAQMSRHRSHARQMDAFDAPGEFDNEPIRPTQPPMIVSDNIVTSPSSLADLNIQAIRAKERVEECVRLELAIGQEMADVQSRIGVDSFEEQLEVAWPTISLIDANHFMSNAIRSTARGRFSPNCRAL